MSILNRYKEWGIKFRLLLDKYFDFVLTIDDTPSINIDSSLTTNCLSAFINFNKKYNCVDNNNIVSSLNSFVYENAINSGCVLEDIYLTGIDNGLIDYNNTGNTFEIQSNDLTLKLYPVTGYTGKYVYPYEYNEDEGYFSFKGGFLQGFYKLFGFDYEVLPNNIEDEWNLEFNIRPRTDYLNDTGYTTGITLNEDTAHTNNDGIFFYMGTRAENKFSYYYNNSNIINSSLTLSDGSELYSYITKEYTTDNKFLTYNRTKTGKTTNDINKDESIILEDNKKNYEDNSFLIFNRTKTGYTTNNINNYFNNLSSSNTTYDTSKDSLGNSFSLKINENGAIEYKMLQSVCVSGETKNSIISGTTQNNLIKYDEWNVLLVKLKVTSGKLNKCNKPNGERKFKMYFYINGLLKFISKEIPLFNFKELNDTYIKQEGVPFNISLGGGTQGLCDCILPDETIFNEILPIEENFAGTFIGDIKSFKFYTCSMQYNQIKNNYLYETK